MVGWLPLAPESTSRSAPASWSRRWQVAVAVGGTVVAVGSGVEVAVGGSTTSTVAGGLPWDTGDATGDAALPAGVDSPPDRYGPATPACSRTIASYQTVPVVPFFSTWRAAKEANFGCPLQNVNTRELMADPAPVADPLSHELLGVGMN